MASDAFQAEEHHAQAANANADAANLAAPVRFVCIFNPALKPCGVSSEVQRAEPDSEPFSSPVLRSEVRKAWI
jgi:hypothetical protein